MQEKMNELLKDTINMNSIEKLDKAKDEFLSYEKEFEKIQDDFKQEDKSDLIDYLISDINKNQIIANNLNLLFESENEIEKAFDSIYDLQEKKIELYLEFNKDYPIENELRKKLDHEVMERKDFRLAQLFGDVKYYSKEVLYQKRDRETFEKWLAKIELFKNFYNNEDTQKYLQIVNKVGNYVVEIKYIEDVEFEIRSKSLNIINKNKKYSQNTKICKIYKIT
jgi:hypothetical protein